MGTTNTAKEYYIVAAVTPRLPGPVLLPGFHALDDLPEGMLEKWLCGGIAVDAGWARARLNRGQEIDIMDAIEEGRRYRRSKAVEQPAAQKVKESSGNA
jgi:hypothetical protein